MKELLEELLLKSGADIEKMYHLQVNYLINTEVNLCI